MGVAKVEVKVGPKIACPRLFSVVRVCVCVLWRPAE